MWEYAPAPENRDIANLKPSYRMFVDGEFVEGAGEPLKTINPATEEVLAEVSTADKNDVDRAVRAARRAAFTARSTSDGAAVDTSASTSSVAGLTVLSGSPPPSTNSPSRYIR